MEFEYADGDGDTLTVSNGKVVDRLYLAVEQGGNGINAVYLDKAAAIRLAREVLRFYGAPLEEPKPEPKEAQVWKDKQGNRVVIRAIDDDGFIGWFDTKGETDCMNGKDFIVFFDFVAENWAGEEK